MPRKIVVGDEKRRKALKSLRGQILRSRKQNKADKQTLAYFAYRTGFPLKSVKEMYEVLVESGRIPTEQTA